MNLNDEVIALSKECKVVAEKLKKTMRKSEGHVTLRLSQALRKLEEASEFVEDAIDVCERGKGQERFRVDKTE